jgi:type II secretory pathway component PulC
LPRNPLASLGTLGRSKIPLVIVLALMLSFVVSSLAGALISSRVMVVQNELAALTSRRQPSILYAGATRDSKSKAIKFDAFNVPERNPAETAEPEPEPEPEAPPMPIESFGLVGTLPSVGAWITVDKNTELVLRRQEFNGYRLEVVEPQMALFTRDGDSFPIYMVYSTAPPRPVAVKPLPSAPAAEEEQAAQAAQTEQSGVVLAAFNGDDGTVTREVLNSLLMNPYAELSKMRLIPTESGMRIAAIRSDALFSRLGMKRGDVITGINGIAITDVGNFANVISSLLTGARFDFQATRDGEAGQLGYAVK